MNKMNLKWNGMLLGVLGILAAEGFSADFGVNGDGTNASVILEGKNINPSLADKIGVQGSSTPKGYWGIGVNGVGGFIGVEAYADPYGSTNNNTGVRYGVQSYAHNGNKNYGVYSFADGSIGAENYGVYGYAGSASSFNYGVYGEAPTTKSSNRAGKFVGVLEYTAGIVGPSDAKLKRNITDLHNCMPRLNRLLPKEFDFKWDEYKTLNLPSSHQKGLIAQDVEAVFPELVHESSVPEARPDHKAAEGEADPNKKPETYKTVDYVGLIPVLIGALQEQAAEIEALKKQVGGAK
jgi:hypothetical protein